MKKINLVYIVSHPIQYQAPLLKQLAKEDGINLLVLFRSDFSLSSYSDKAFGQAVHWDIPLVEGYAYKVLPNVGGNKTFNFFLPFNYGLRKILKEHKTDVIWLHGYSSFFNLSSILLAKSMGIKVLVRGETHLLATKKGTGREKLRKPFFKLLNKMVDGFLTIGTANREFYRGFHIPEEKLFFSPYVVDNDFFQAKVKKAHDTLPELRQALNLEPDKPVILYASSMIARKHPDDLLEAYIKLSSDGVTPPAAYLLFVGDGELRAQLEKRASELKWSTIQFLGFKNQTELPAFYALCDVFILPSTGETWGLVVNEAMNAAKAIILTREIGSGQDLVKDEVNGYRYPARDIEALSLCLRKMIEDPIVFKKMGEASIRMINQWGIPQAVEGIKAACIAVTKRGSYCE